MVKNSCFMLNSIHSFAPVFTEFFPLIYIFSCTNTEAKAATDRSSEDNVDMSWRNSNPKGWPKIKWRKARVNSEAFTDDSVYDVTPLVYAAQLERQEVIHMLLTKYKRLSDIHPVTRKTSILCNTKT